MRSFIKYGLWSIILFIITGIILTAVFDMEQGWILIGITILFCIFIYLPGILISKIKNDNANALKWINYVGFSGIFLGVTATVFRMFHWPAGSVIAVTGVFVFAFNYLPFWFYYQWKNKSKVDKYFYLIFCSALGSFIVYYLFKSQKWPGATNAGKLSLLFFVLLGIYFLVVKYIKKDKNFSPSIKQQFLFGFIIAYVLSGVQNRVITSNIINSSSTGFENAQKNLTAYSNKNKFIYEAFSKIAGSSDSLENKYLTNANKLKSISNKTDSVLKSIKPLLIIATDGVLPQVADTIAFKDIVSKDNYDIPTYLLIGTDRNNPKKLPENPLKDPITAVQLKQVLKQFLDTIVALTPEETQTQIKQSLIIDLSDVEVEEGVESWEVNTFDHVGLGAVLTKLTQFEADVRYCEQIVLNDLFNRASAASKSNVAAQLADLAMKYETEKKEKEITILQKDKELNVSRLEAKDIELEKTQQTISVFIIVLLLVSLLVVFIVRSNLLRKKANQLLQKQKSEIEGQKHLIEHQKQEIVDSVNYAQRIQHAILPEQNHISEFIKNYFLLYQPKDIVSGDFYFFHKLSNNKAILAVCDCTGHGVPGAFMSLIGSNALKQVVVEKKITEPSQILYHVNKEICETLKQNQNQSRDGMDVALISIEKDELNKRIILRYAGANRPLWLIKNATKELIEYKPDKLAIGGFQLNEERNFAEQEIILNEKDSAYIFSDGFADQFGGPQGKKMMTKKFKEVLLEICDKNCTDQNEILHKHYDGWKGVLEQVDDVLVVGLKMG